MRSFCSCEAWEAQHGSTTKEPVSQRWKLSGKKGPKSCSLVFMEALLHSNDWLNHWPLVVDSTSSPSLLPEDQGWDWKFQPLCSTWSLLLATSPYLWVRSKVTFPVEFSGTEDERSNIICHHPTFCAQKIPEVLGAVNKERWMKTKYIWNTHRHTSI